MASNYIINLEAFLNPESLANVQKTIDAKKMTINVDIQTGDLAKYQTKLENFYKKYSSMLGSEVLGKIDLSGYVAKYNEILSQLTPGLSKKQTAILTKQLDSIMQQMQSTVNAKKIEIDVGLKAEDYQNKIDSIINKNKDLFNKNDDLKKSADYMNVLVQKFSEGKVGTEQMTAEMGRFRDQIELAKGNSSDLGNTLKSMLSYFVSYRLIDVVFQTFNQGIKESIDYVVKMDATMSEFRYVTGMSKDQVDDLRTSFSELGQQVGATTEEVASASLEYVRQGKSIQDSMKLATESLKLAKLADIESSQATEYLTSAVNGYKQSGIEASDVVDKLIAV